MGNKQTFAAEVKATFQDRTIEKFWWYIAFETEKANCSRGQQHAQPAGPDS
jgi:hypothetical protein